MKRGAGSGKHAHTTSVSAMEKDATLTLFNLLFTAEDRDGPREQ